MAPPFPPLPPLHPESTGTRVRVKTQSEVPDDSFLQSDAPLIFLKLRKMIASDQQSTDTILGTIAVAAHSLTSATGAAVAMPRDGAVVCVGRSGETAPELGERINVDSGISGECLRTGVIMRCDDASRDYHVDAEVCRELGLQSIAVVPLRGRQGRVGVLEVFSTESFAFDQDKMDLLGRLAGLAEAAWARGVVAGELAEDLMAAPATLSAGVEPVTGLVYPAPTVVPSAETASVRFGATLHARGTDKWRLAYIAAVAILALILLSIFGWRAWYRASLASKASHRTLAGASISARNTSAALESTQPDIVRPSPARPSQRAAQPVIVPDEVIRRPRQSTPPNHQKSANESTPAADSKSEFNSEEIPLISSTSADPGQLSQVLSAAPALPTLGPPVSQGVAGGVLIRKVQPIYPPEARRRHLQGKVVLDAVVTTHGEIEQLKLVKGDVLLAKAAMDAVRQWRYSPYSLNGKVIPKETRITISFIAP
jgi:TonB family protein